MSESTPGPWRIPGANIFRVVAPDAPHQNKPSGMCPPYAWAVVCETDPESVGGPQAAANARLISAAPDLLAACRSVLEMLGSDAHCYKTGELAKAAVAKAEGVKSSAESPVP
jgi:hypothetical protein